MVNYIKADLYRILHNKKLWIYFGSLIALSATLIFFCIVKGIFAYDSSRFPTMLGLGIIFSSFFLGIPLLIILYEDDLKFQSLQFVLTSRLNKLQFILSKLIISIITILVPYLILLGYSFILSLIASPLSDEDWGNLLLKGIAVIIGSVIYFSLASLISYITQSSTLGIILFIFFLTGIITQILSLLATALKFLEPLIEYTPYSLVTSLQTQVSHGSSLDISNILLLLLYVIIASVISAIVLSKIEIKTA